MLTAVSEQEIRRALAAGEYSPFVEPDIIDLLGELDRVRGEAAALASARDDLRGELSAADAECRRLREDLATAAASLEAYRERHAELWAEAQALSSACAAADAYGAASEADRFRLVRELAEARDAVRRLGAAESAALESRDAEYFRRERAEREAGELRARVAELESRRVEFVREPEGDGEAALRGEVERLRARLAEETRAAAAAESEAAGVIAGLRAEAGRLAESVRLLGVG